MTNPLKQRAMTDQEMRDADEFFMSKFEEGKMSNEEINKAIAEWCGWKCLQCNGTRIVEDYSFKNPGEKIKNKCRCKYRPDYASDLNAVHEVEKKLDPHLRNDLVATLWKITGNEARSVNFWTEYNFRGFYACFHATARQRCEALLRTIGRWEECQPDPISNHRING